MTIEDVANEAETCSKLIRQFLGIKQPTPVEPVDLDDDDRYGIYFQ